MKVIAEFVDVRSGKRYFPGDGDKIDPALQDEQLVRLKRAGCLAEGDEAKESKPAPSGLSAMKKDDLIALAELHKVDLPKDASKQTIIEQLEAANVKPE